MSDPTTAELFAANFIQLTQLLKSVKQTVEKGTSNDAAKVGGSTKAELLELAKETGLIHIGVTAPTERRYVGWLSVDQEDFDLYFDVGDTEPVWTSVIKPGPKGDEGPAGGTTVNIPAAFGIPYPTNEVFDGRTVWACRIDLGNPINGQKSVSIPSAVKADWDKTTVNIDLSRSYTTIDRGPTSGGVVKVPLIFISSVNYMNIEFSTTREQLDIETSTDLWAGYQAIVTIMYLKEVI